MSSASLLGLNESIYSHDKYTQMTINTAFERVIRVQNASKSDKTFDPRESPRDSPPSPSPQGYIHSQKYEQRLYITI